MNRFLKAGLIAGGLLAGLIIGLTVRADGLFQLVRSALQPAATATSPEASKESHDDEHSDHLDLSRTAQKSLGLKLGTLQPQDFVRSVQIPGEIVEKPGHSGRTVPARMYGIIERIHCVPGQLLKPGEPLFDVRLTGDALATAQSSLVESLVQITRTRQELVRISDLVEKGSLPARQKLDTEFELRKLEARRDLLRQELLIRGLTAPQIDSIVQTGQLLDRIIIHVPERDEDGSGGQVVPALRTVAAQANDLTAPQPVRNTPAANGDDDYFTVETIDVQPGASISPGDQLAHLAWHNVLYVEGHAFERDLELITRLLKQNTGAQIEFGPRDEEDTLTGLPIRFVDNHVDTQAGTFRLYLELRNQIVHESRDEQGRIYRSWKFKPGQRLHVSLPVETISGHFVLPRDAIAQEGLESFVFRREEHAHEEPASEPVGTKKADDHGHNHSHGHDHSHGEEDAFHRIPVRIVASNVRQVVVASDGELKPGDEIALTHAFQLQLALRSGASSHAHHGHEH